VEAQAARETARRIMGRSSAGQANGQEHPRAASGSAGIEDDDFEAQLGEGPLSVLPENAVRCCMTAVGTSPGLQSSCALQMAWFWQT
jgi:hypothetical protein